MEPEPVSVHDGLNSCCGGMGEGCGPPKLIAQGPGLSKSNTATN